jgi:hypothetical protein
MKKMIRESPSTVKKRKKSHFRKELGFVTSLNDIKNTINSLTARISPVSFSTRELTKLAEKILKNLKTVSLMLHNSDKVSTRLQVSSHSGKFFPLNPSTDLNDTVSHSIRRTSSLDVEVGGTRIST